MHVQRAIEAAGIPTILITVEPSQTAQARSPRAVQPIRHAIGTPVGPAGDGDEQRKTILATFATLREPIAPGVIREIG